MNDHPPSRNAFPVLVMCHVRNPAGKEPALTLTQIQLCAALPSSAFSDDSGRVTRAMIFGRNTNH